MIQNNCHNIERKEFREFFFINSITDFILLSLYGMHYPLHARVSALGKIPYLVTDVKFVLSFCTLLKLVKTDNLISYFYRVLFYFILFYAGNALARVHKHVYFWDITFCTRKF